MKSILRSTLTGLILTTGIATAQAADLSGHYPPPPPVPVAAPAAAEGGWYLRGDLGVSVHRNAKWHESEIQNADPTDTFNDWLSTKSGNSANLAVGVGYQFNDWLRADVTGEYRFASNLKGIQAQTTSAPAYYWATDKADLTSWVFLANVYADIGDFNGLKPYIGAGIGAALNQISDAGQISGGAGTGSYGTYGDGDKWNMAGALYAGLGYEITKQLTLDVGYRFLWLGDASTGKKTCYNPANTDPAAGCIDTGTATNEKWWLTGLSSQDIRVGLRYKFYEDTPHYAMPVMAKN